MVDGGWEGKLMVALCVQSRNKFKEKDENWSLWPLALVFSISLEPQLCSGMGRLALRVGLPQSLSSVEPLWKHPHRHTQRCVLDDSKSSHLAKNYEHHL